MSNNTYYNIYLNNNIELVYSMIIKLDCVADAMNVEMRDYGIAVSEDKLTWRYYKHLAGMYHSSDEDMIIRSLDTGDDIVFNSDTIKHHKKTRSLYKSDPSYVEDLIVRYPSQSNLIKGILYPVDIHTAVNAKNGSILYYDKSYVEPQELNLIYDTEDWIRSVLYRTAMEAYAEADDLFTASLCGLIYSNLPMAIMDIRIKYVKTAMAHTFHISNYLASYNRLDEFMPYLTFEQQLFLYMNIDYIVRHTGMADTFDILLEKLLTLRNLPVFDYTLRQSTIELEEGKLQPTPKFSRDKLNMNRGLQTRNVDTRDVASVIYKEVNQAVDNLSMLTHYTRIAERDASQSSISKLPSKILEVSAIDPEDIEPSKLVDVVINEWAYHSVNGTYTNLVELINPLNGDMFKMDTNEAFMLYLYAYAKGFLNIDLDEIPPYLAHNVAKHEWINESEYLAIVETSNFNHWDRDIDFFMMSNLELTENIATASEFMERCITLNDRRRTRYQWVENKYTIADRAGNAVLMNHCYKDVWCDLKGKRYQTYSDLFTAYAIDSERIDREMWKDIAMDCLDKATDYTSSNVISLRDIQANMVKLFKRLSSYTIQFLEEIASNDVAIANSIIAIPGETGQAVSGTLFIPNTRTTMLSHTASEKYTADAIVRPVESLWLEYDNDIEVDATIGIDAIFDVDTISTCNVALGQVKVLEATMELSNNDDTIRK